MMPNRSFRAATIRGPENDKTPRPADAEPGLSFFHALTFPAAALHLDPHVLPLVPQVPGGALGIVPVAVRADGVAVPEMADEHVVPDVVVVIVGGRRLGRLNWTQNHASAAG